MSVHVSACRGCSRDVHVKQRRVGVEERVDGVCRQQEHGTPKKSYLTSKIGHCSERDRSLR